MVCFPSSISVENCFTPLLSTKGLADLIPHGNLHDFRFLFFNIFKRSFTLFRAVISIHSVVSPASSRSAILLNLYCFYYIFPVFFWKPLLIIDVIGVRKILKIQYRKENFYEEEILRSSAGTDSRAFCRTAYRLQQRLRRRNDDRPDRS